MSCQHLKNSGTVKGSVGRPFLTRPCPVLAPEFSSRPTDPWTVLKTMGGQESKSIGPISLLDALG